MPTLAALLKEEISKIARKEVQDQVRELKQIVRAQRDAIARLEKQLGSTKAKATAKPAATKPAATKPAATKPAAKVRKPAAKARKPAGDTDRRKQLRIAPNTIKKHRKRLKLSQADLGEILNVSTNTVLRWEAGTSKPRSKHLPGLDQLRTISKRELKKQLGE